MHLARKLRLAALPGGLALALPLAAYANAFPDADLANGKAVYESKQCAACHMQKTSRDEAFIYQRDDRKVKTLFELRRYVSLCNMELKLDLFPDEERDVGAYVNQQYYKLTK